MGSQIVGLVSLDALLTTADYFIQKDNLMILTEQQKIMLVSPFSNITLQCIWYVERYICYMQLMIAIIFINDNG